MNHRRMTRSCSPVQPQDVEDMTYEERKGREVWWFCPECGVSWRATVAEREEGGGCPACGHVARDAEAEA